jgi:hypothetical protein
MEDTKEPKNLVPGDIVRFTTVRGTRAVGFYWGMKSRRDSYDRDDPDRRNLMDDSPDLIQGKAGCRGKGHFFSMGSAHTGLALPNKEVSYRTEPLPGFFLNDECGNMLIKNETVRDYRVLEDEVFEELTLDGITRGRERLVGDVVKFGFGGMDLVGIVTGYSDTPMTIPPRYSIEPMTDWSPIPVFLEMKRYRGEDSKKSYSPRVKIGKRVEMTDRIGGSRKTIVTGFLDLPAYILYVHRG